MRSLLLLSVLTACAGDPPAGVDMCTKATYDSCITEHDCTSGVCHSFNGEFMICTQSCDTANPCPNDEAGKPGTCNMMGICKPTVANSCEL